MLALANLRNWALFAVFSVLAVMLYRSGEQRSAALQDLVHAQQRIDEMQKAQLSAAVRHAERGIELAAREQKALEEYHGELELVRQQLADLRDSGGLRDDLEAFTRRGGAGDDAEARARDLEARVALLGELLAAGDDLLGEGRQLARSLAQSAEGHTSEVRLLRQTCSPR